MHRRKFMQVVSALCRTVPFWALSPGAFAQPTIRSTIDTNANSSRKILVVYAASGGLDPNAWCNPRNNPLYGRYAKKATGPTDGPIVCAPMGAPIDGQANLLSNEVFFEKHKDRTLIFNGLDMQNSDHEGGKIAISGRRGSEFPHLCELYAANISKSVLPWITKEGHERGYELVTRTIIPRHSQFIKVFYPNFSNDIGYVDYNNREAIQTARYQRMQAILGDPGNRLTTRTKRFDEFIEASGLRFAANEIISNFGGDIGVPTEDIDVAMWAAKLGFTNSIEVGGRRFFNEGFDGHESLVFKYNKYSLPFMTKRLDRIWSLAEKFGFANRLVVYVASEMGRNIFNENIDKKHYEQTGIELYTGKSHYSIGTATIMADDIIGNRVIGATDGDNKQIKIDFKTGQPKADGKSLTHPVLLQALRNYLGINDQRFPLFSPGEEIIDLKNSNIKTGYPAYSHPDKPADFSGNRPAGFDY